MIGFIDYLQFLHKHKFVGSEITRITDFCIWNPFKILKTHKLKLENKGKLLPLSSTFIQNYYEGQSASPLTELVFYEIERQIRSV